MAHNKKYVVPKEWNTDRDQKGVFRACPLPSKPLNLSIPLLYLKSELKAKGVSLDKVNLRINGRRLNKMTDLVCLLDVISDSKVSHRLIGQDHSLKLEPVDLEAPLFFIPLYNPYEDYKKDSTRITSYQGFTERVGVETYPFLIKNAFFLKTKNQLRPVLPEPGYKVTFLRGKEKFTTTELSAVSQKEYITKNKEGQFIKLDPKRVGRDYLIYC